MKYRIEPYEAVNNSTFTFYKLYVDGKCLFDEFCEEVNLNDKDKNALKKIHSYMDNLGTSLMPKTKFNHVKDGKRSDLFEFKKDSLRVYVIKKNPSVYIVVGGYKATQKKDIKRFKERIKGFPEK